MQVNGTLVEPILASMREMVDTRVRAHTCALLEFQVIQCKLTQWLMNSTIKKSSQWLIWWRVNEWNL